MPETVESFEMITLADFTVQNEDSVYELLDRVFHWQIKFSLELSPISGGITNSLLMVHNKSTNERVLIRLYGKSTDTIIERQRELVAHQMLFDLGLASKLYAKFNNGIVYGFIHGTPLNFIDLPKWSKPIATHLAVIHSKLDIDSFQSQLDVKTLSSIWPILNHWVNQIQNDQLKMELEWLERTIGGTSKLVACHSDLLAGNIIMSKDGDVSFIDYEYMMVGPRAFDIANHFMEWQGFDCESFRVPDPRSGTVRKWCEYYLEETGEVDQLDQLVKEVRLHYGLPGFFGGLGPDPIQY